AVVSVRRPVRAGPGRHRDDRIEVSIELVDRFRHARDVRLGEVALVRRRLDLVHRQRGKDLPVAAEWVAVFGEDGAVIGFDRGTQRIDRRRRRGARELSRLEATRGGFCRRLLLFPLGRGLGGFGGRHGSGRGGWSWTTLNDTRLPATAVNSLEHWH